MKVELDVSKALQLIHKDLTNIRIEIAKLQVKSTLWGMSGALFVLLPTILLIYLSK